MKNAMKRTAQAAVIAISMMATAACSGGDAGGDIGVDMDEIRKVMPDIDADLVKKACEEGKLTYFQIGASSAASAVESFKKLMPCLTVTGISGTSGVLEQRFTAALSSGTGIPDWYENTDAAILQAHADKGVFVDYTPSNAKNLIGKFVGPWYPIFSGPIGFLYNTKAVTPEQAKKLTTWDALLDPAFAKQDIALISPQSGGGALTSWYHMIADGGPEIVEDFAKLNVSSFSTSREAGDSIVSGENAIAFPFSGTTAIQLIRSGAPVRVAYPSPVDVVAAGAGVVKRGTNSAAAQVYGNFMLSDQTQELYSRDLGSIPVTSTVPFENDVTKEEWWNLPTDLFKYDPLEIGKERSQISSAYDNAIK